MTRRQECLLWAFLSVLIGTQFDGFLRVSWFLLGVVWFVESILALHGKKLSVDTS